MHLSTQLLSLATLAVLLTTVDAAASQNPTQRSGFSEATRSLRQTPLHLAQADDRKAEADGLYQKGREQFDTSQYQAALESWQAALEIYQDPEVQAAFPQESRRGEGNALRGLGNVYFVQAQYEQATGFYEQSLQIAREIGDRQGEGRTLNNLGNNYHVLGQHEQAVSFYSQALEIAREIGDLQGEGLALNNLGNDHHKLGQYQQAITLYEQYLAIAREIGDRQGEVLVLSNLGNTYADLGQYEEAIAFYEQSLVITREISDRVDEVLVLSNLGSVYLDHLNDYRQAIHVYDQKLAIAREIGDRQGEGDTLHNLGLSYYNLGQYEQAVDFYKQSLTIAREIGDQYTEGLALGGLGNVYDFVGQYEKAISFYEQQLEISHEVNDQYVEGLALGGLGNTHRNIGQYEQAIIFYEQQLEIDRETRNRRGESKALSGLGLAYQSLEQYEQAISFHEQSLEIAREIGIRPEQSRSLGNLGNIYMLLSQYEQAINFYTQSLAIIRDVGDKQGQGVVLGNLGVAYRQLNRYEEAISNHQQALAIALEIGDRAGVGRHLYNVGKILINAAQYEQAEIFLVQSIEIYESLRTDLNDDQLITIADTQAQAYANLERALTAQKKSTEALAITERGRGRAFVLQLASRLASEEERAALEASPVAQVPTVAEIQQIARDTNTTLVTYSQIFDQALYIWVVQPTGEIEFREVEFDGSGEEGTIVNPISSIDGPVYRSAAPESELTALVNDARSLRFRSANTTTTDAAEVNSNPTTPQLQELHQVLIDPIADLLPSDPNAQVVFIPQGQLFLVPFAALQDDDGTYLIEKHTILTAPSIQVFGLANEAAGTRNFASLPTDDALIVGNPTMPTVWLTNEDGDLAETQLSYLIGAKAEAEAIGEFFNIPALTGEQATEARVKQELPNASLIHLATHGLLEYGIPESSGVLDLPGAIALAPGNGEDGLLTSAEILEMDLQADLAILSACDTGRGRITGDGVVGLSRALITAGVPSVMVSLWAVNDDSTSLLMQRFYEFLATGEFTKAEALRQAQLSLLYDEDIETRLEAVRADISIETSGRRDVPTGSRHPYHWAPFILIGNGL